MKIEDMPTDTLRALIHRQLDDRQRHERAIAEADEALRETLGEFHRRCNEPPKESPK